MDKVLDGSGGSPSALVLRPTIKGVGTVANDVEIRKSSRVTMQASLRFSSDGIPKVSDDKTLRAVVGSKEEMVMGVMILPPFD